MPTKSHLIALRYLFILCALTFPLSVLPNTDERLEIICEEITHIGYASAYLPYTFELSQKGEAMAEWQFILSHIEGKEICIKKQEGGSTFAIDPSIDQTFINEAGKMVGRIQYTYEKNGNLQTLSYKLTLDCAPKILEISDTVRHIPPEYVSLYDFSCNIHYVGASSVTIGVEQEYSSFYDVIHIYEAPLAHVDIPSLSLGNDVWVDITVNNEYGEDKQTIKIPAYFRLSAVESPTDESTFDHIDVYSLDGRFFGRFRKSNEIPNRKGTVLLLRYFDADNHLLRTKKILNP